jgi:Zn-dependent protease with chaperone function
MNALCFGQDLPGAGVPCRVEVSDSGLSMALSTDPTGTSPTLVPFELLDVEAGGLDYDHLVVKWVRDGVDRTLYLKDPALIRAFRHAAPPDLMARFEHTAQQVRKARLNRRVMYGTGIGILIAVILAIWLGSDVMVKLVVDQIPIEWEQTIGETARAQFLSGHSVIKEGQAVRAVEEITKRLSDQIPHNPYQFQVTVVRSDTVNAFALPGGYVVVFTGLLRKAESPEEVAGVLSHELNHVLLRHGMSRIVKTAGIMAVVSILIGDQQGGGGMAKQLGVDLLTLKFGREQETEADLEGLRLLNRARIAPDGMIHFFERLSDHDKLQVELLSTHPMSSRRAELLKAEAASLPKQSPEPFTFEWKDVQGSL